MEVNHNASTPGPVPSHGCLDQQFPIPYPIGLAMVRHGYPRHPKWLPNDQFSYLLTGFFHVKADMAFLPLFSQPPTETMAYFGCPHSPKHPVICSGFQLIRVFSYALMLYGVFNSNGASEILRLFVGHRLLDQDDYELGQFETERLAALEFLRGVLIRLSIVMLVNPIQQFFPPKENEYYPNAFTQPAYMTPLSLTDPEHQWRVKEVGEQLSRFADALIHYGN